MSKTSALFAVALLAAALFVPSVAGAEEYKPKVDRTDLIDQEGLASGSGLAAKMLRLKLPAGFVGGRHFHTGDVFVYVESGALQVVTDAGTKSYKAGEGFYETPGQTMHARNEAANAETVIVVFQVGPTGEPLMVKAD